MVSIMSASRRSGEGRVVLERGETGGENPAKYIFEEIIGKQKSSSHDLAVYIYQLIERLKGVDKDKLSKGLPAGETRNDFLRSANSFLTNCELVSKGLESKGTFQFDLGGASFKVRLIYKNQEADSGEEETEQNSNNEENHSILAKPKEYTHEGKTLVLGLVYLNDRNLREQEKTQYQYGGLAKTWNNLSL